jgi:transcriptional regulator with XRE-family HTH domain
MSLYDRVAAIRGGGRALAGARLRRAVLKALHRAFLASSMGSQAELAKRLKVRRSAVNQVFRGDGNVRINTLAEYLYEMGYEIDITLVKSGELRTAELEKPDTESSAPPPPPQPVEGTPVEVPHINFDEPTGNALAEVRKGNLTWMLTWMKAH